MKVVELSRYGGPDAMRLVEVPDPRPRAGEAVVRVCAAGVNFADTLMRQGRYAINPPLPTVLGSEAAGVVEALGEDVAGPAVGTRVAAPIFAAGILTGGYAERVVLPAALLTPLPDAVGFEEAAALQVQGLTAAYLLKQVPVEGRRVLVHSAAGGVGSLLVQLAKLAGARQVVAAAGTPQKRALARSLGADAEVDYTDPAWPEAVRSATDGAGVDVVFDAGSLTPAPSLEVLAFGGQMVVYGSLSLQTFALGPAEIGGLVFKNGSLRGFALPTLLTPEGLHTELAKLFDLLIRGAIQVVRGGDYPLERAADAHRALESRSTVGKLVLWASTSPSP